MGTTTNFGWTTPENTDAVTNGALAIRTLAGEIDSTVAGLAGKWVNGGIYTNVTGNSTSHSAIASAEVAYVPFIIPNDVTLASVSISVSDTAIATSYLGVYSSDADTYLPDALVTSFGSFSGSTTGVKTISTTQALNAGLYWFALKLNNSVSYSVDAVREGAVPSYLFAKSSGSIATRISLSGHMCLVGTDGATGALASTPPATLTISGTAPLIVVAVA